MNFKELTHTYKGKKVFLTGHTGFKGSWFLCMLKLLGAQVKGYSLAPETKNALFNLVKGDELCDSVIADIRDESKLADEISVFQPDFVFHFAAQSLVRQSYQIPLETIEINVMGTANLLNAVNKIKKPCAVIVITTDKVYENREWIYPYRETDKLGGYDTYSASKACAEIIVNSFRQSFFKSTDDGKQLKGLATARAGNVIGGGDRAKDRIIPDLVNSLENKQIIKVRNPNAIRPWQHVLEPLYGYLLLGSKLYNNPLLYSDAFNFGPAMESHLKVEELVNIAIDVWGEGKYELSENKNKLHEAGILKLDINKSFNLLAWQPLLSASEAIKETIFWYKEHNKTNPRELTMQQINNFWK